ncbi:hypothetical protein EML15_06310 [Corynebacterium sp. sy017]|uniref:PPA1309 family protein n=1 Tax=unclassified Corynebacterium TaxID=2624378 RepID=UPI0011863BFE|nr:MULTISPECIES: PPA1309 family protein [unclassified Corynebacterium]MBP3088763.1 hypothetical protein [Corynebacterium sp. sy017]TSD92044.1 hypothetical protein ELY17_06310 [Corynebacterium sp. SY003]
MTTSAFPPQALNKSMLEAVDFIHAEGWDQPPTLFALVPASLLDDAMPEVFAEEDEHTPLALVVQDMLPEHILPGSEELGEFLASIVWPDQVVGAVLAQEIMFYDSSASDSSTSITDAALDISAVPQARPARLFSGVLGTYAQLTLLQLRPSEEELAAKGPFAEDDIELRGGENIAPGVIAALQYPFEHPGGY